MKAFRFVGGAVLAAILGASSAARADDALPQGVVVVDEGGDAWLHDHCSFRGAKAFAPEDVTPVGSVVTMLYTRSKGLFSSEIVVKTFRCGERPPFALMAFAPAPENEVMCVDVKTSCARPIRNATPPKAPESSTAAKVEAAPPKVGEKAEKPKPPEMPEPSTPASKGWAKKKAKEKVVTEVAAKAPAKKNGAKARLAVAVSRTSDPGY